MPTAILTATLGARPGGIFSGMRSHAKRAITVLNNYGLILAQVFMSGNDILMR